MAGGQEKQKTGKAFVLTLRVLRGKKPLSLSFVSPGVFRGKTAFLFTMKNAEKHEKKITAQRTIFRQEDETKHNSH